ncbi:PEP/pyruvate-binding domain-containing protein, partial [Bacillus sp. JJ1503]|uniref:PEP/pyruvate-binding domain-containing protein n=1 Tax=Bacillus sp. JJ1503 TaxID=3122956 RepID=UPI002FFDE01C
NNIHQASLIDMFQELINRGYRIKAIDVEGQWAKLNSTKDLSHFIFGTKGETLERLKPLLLSAKICEQVRFEVQEWEDNQSGCIELIQNKFPNVKLVVRSSSLIEDTADHSFAGAFESFFNIDSNNISQLEESIESVIKSYEEVAAGNTSLNQILVQPQLVDVAISGVLFTRDLETASPYYIVNYDDKTSRTNSVTAGTDNLKTLVVFKECIEEVKNEELKKLLKVTKEIEMIIGNETIDIEFAITHKGEIYIFQVRPIAALKGKSIVSIDDFIIWLSKTQKFIRCLDTNKTSDLLGDRTILANMPDWNPAELIGTKPKPLAYSLYEYLITNDVWREARGSIGYHNPTSESLMKSVFGQPYIDVRVSFNTLLPKTISPDLGRQLINYYINYLTEHPELHDKVEFEVIPTCISFDMTKFENNLFEAGFTRTEINELNTELFKLTNNIISGKFTTVSEQLKLVKSLNYKREYVKTTISSIENIPYLIKVLLDDCKEYGTKPFTILARYAFIAVSFLKSFIQRGIITYSEYTNFLESVETIASNTVNDFAKVMQGEMSRGKFLEIYGHLRPGTYDINSARYDEKPDVYLKPTDLTNNNEKIKNSLQ